MLTDKLQNANMPLVSVITAVLNNEKGIRKTIESIKCQTYDNIEYIVIDGGSKDKTVDIIKSNKKYINFWVSEKDNGIYDAMNKGIRNAKGEFIGMLNAGDWYEIDAIEKVVDFLNENDMFRKEYIITGDRISRKKDGKINSKIVPHSNYKKMINHTLPISHCATFVSRDIYMKYGMYNTSYKSSADMEFFLRINKQYGIEPFYIPEVMVNTMPGGMSYSIKGMLESTIISLKYGTPIISVLYYFFFKLFRGFIYKYASYSIFKKIYHKTNKRYIDPN